MRSFKKMSIDKKSKILIFAILLFALNGVYRTNGLKVPSLVHLVKNGADGDEGLCVAFDEETYSAIEWSYPIPEDEHSLPETVSSYLPTQSSPHDCNFEEDQACNKIWKLDNYTIPHHTPRNYVPIFDSRWEDFRTYFTTNGTNIIDNRFEIPKNANIGVSVRSGSSVDILLSTGFNPETYQYYKITLGGNTKKEVFLTKHSEDKRLSKYENDIPVISVDEWKSFNLFLSETGHIQLHDVNKNILYLNTTEPEISNTLYLFINSSLPALWKIHKNHFLYTNTTQSIPFGPPINVTSSTMCLSMYLMMCKDCSIYFYTVRDSPEIILEIHPSIEDDSFYKWKNIRLIVENNTDDSVQLFVKTRSGATDKFWAIDNIRTCVKDEFKIRKLIKGNFSQKLNMNDPTLTCHSFKFPEYRPKKQLISSKELPVINSSEHTTSLELSWKTLYQQPYIINYKGSDICNRDTVSEFKSQQRVKSNGWIVLKPKETTVTIDNLVPYTHYDVSIFDPVFGANKSVSLNTYPTVKPTKDELPEVKIRAEINEAVIVISPRKCNVSYGPIVHRIDLKQQSYPHILIDDIKYTWKNLTPYENYTLIVETARNINSLNDTSLNVGSSYNFTTKPSVAPALDYAEVYESSETSVSFRYRLPEKANGVPTRVDVTFCNGLQRNKCSNNITYITPCKFWKDMYCVTINDLMKNKNYTFGLSIKNIDTNSFGKEFYISQQTIEKAPGMPTNISYKVNNCSDFSEYCHLNVSWSHPFNQSGVINAFEISLQEKTDVISDVISETVQIENKSYLPVYWREIQFVPYAKTYNMSIRATNYVYKSQDARMVVKIDHPAQHIDQLPKIVANGTNEITYGIPKLDYRLNSSTVIVIVQRNDAIKTSISPEIIHIAQNDLCLRERTSWIAGAWEVLHDGTTNMTIGNNAKIYSNIINATIVNQALLPKTDYCINFVIRNIYKNTTHVTVHHEKHVTLLEATKTSKGPTSEYVSTNAISVGSIIVIILLIILVAGVIAFIVYRRRKQRRTARRRSYYGEPIYESMPSDDYNDSLNVVYNAIYDKLNHES